ncbi:hypothetical protein V6N12_070873 [Hibiscus sabdariffa]|uniref:Uncharacterized protein n=1 Tax=Hibiscus sabdariffa TaxID=183260 RepID=A0ABR2FIL8_9ROSI
MVSYDTEIFGYVDKKLKVVKAKEFGEKEWLLHLGEQYFSDGLHGDDFTSSLGFLLRMLNQMNGILLTYCDGICMILISSGKRQPVMVIDG